MPLFMALIGDWRFWVIVTLAGAIGFGWVQTKRLGWCQANQEALQTEFDTFKAQVAAQGEIAQQKANQQAAADKLRKEREDANHKATVALLNQRISSLRHDADSSGRYLLPAAAAGSNRPDLACFDRADFERASRGVLGELRAIADQGDAATVGLDAARAWAQGR